MAHEYEASPTMPLGRLAEPFNRASQIERKIDDLTAARQRERGTQGRELQRIHRARARHQECQQDRTPFQRAR
ncbi:hypothetical protein GKE82_23950 [Conexibacter sp. W3-3-2]|uniref:hypothetical protein n=1 Tax=Conexibacter sp. W3-3-2 TaxID=2675227 RepID=UPI0012B993BC|nr:hypothetical protein [Conexibacter sp. W3-3-2]MTD47261.1 hypothetical protein [Conexibacter sp. W3-3-2]